MSDKLLSKDQWQMQWLARLPHPIPAYCWTNGAACPWCGFANEVVSFTKSNSCSECGKPFWFGVPPWAENNDLYSWVTPTPADHEILRVNPTLFPIWEPNDRLKEIYFRITTQDMKVGRA